VFVTYTARNIEIVITVLKFINDYGYLVTGKMLFRSNGVYFTFVLTVD